MENGFFVQRFQIEKFSIISKLVENCFHISSSTWANLYSRCISDMAETLVYNNLNYINCKCPEKYFVQRGIGSKTIMSMKDVFAVSSDIYPL